MKRRTGVDGHIYLRHVDGHRVPVHVRCQSICDSENRVVGAVEIFSEDAAHREALSEIRKLHDLAQTDPLTQLPNRRTAELLIQHRLAEAHATRKPLTLLFVDIDDFKHFNDTYGHNTGDRILRVVARSLEACLRESDVVARWGGEEFVVVLPSTDGTRALKAAERIRNLLRTSTIADQGRVLRVSVSIGGTLATTADEPQAIVARADEAMYVSKRTGKDRTTLV